MDQKKNYTVEDNIKSMLFVMKDLLKEVQELKTQLGGKSNIDSKSDIF